MLAPRFQAAALTDAIHSFARAVADLPPDPRFSQRPRAFLVGGCVRDALLGLPSKDADMEIYGVAPDTLERLAHTLFADVDTVGQSFAVLKAFVEGGDLDLAIPRRERKAGRGHTGFFIESDPDLSFEEACRRRDFTVNAMLLDPLTGELIDPFHGQEDLSRKRLRIVDASFFPDDPLRVYRAVQFASRFGFFIEPISLALLVSMVEHGDLAELSAERVTDELRKLLLQSEAPSIGCALLRELGIVSQTYPELEALAHTPQEPAWHPEGDVWTHTLLSLDQAAALIRREPFNEAQALGVMLGTLCHDLGKPATTALGEKDGVPRLRSLGHEEAGVAPTRSLLARWTFGEDALAAAIACAKEHLKPGMLFQQLQKGTLTEDAYTNAVRKLIRRLHPVSWRVLLACAEADHRGRTLPGIATEPYAAGLRFAETARALEVDRDALKPLLQGRDLLALGYAPGPRIGERMADVEALRDEGKLATREDAIRWVQAQPPTP